MRNEIWSLIQRLVVFDEPVAKWAHFRSSITKLDKRIANALGQEAQDGGWEHALRQKLGESFALSDQEVKLGRRFAAAFAQEEAGRFTTIAFEMWRHKFASDILVAKRKSDDSLRSQWVETFAGLGPIFATLLREGPWQDDARGQFLLECLASLKIEMKQNDPASPAFGLEEKRRSRHWLPANLLPDLIVLVEGATEAVLLPLLADCLQLDLQKERALLIPAGGANQVVKKYLYLKEVYSLPIFVVLDRDAEDQSDILASSLRDTDRLHVLADGEIEDILRLEILVPMLNRYIADLPGIVDDNLPIKCEHFSLGVPRKQVLAKLWRERELGKFDKVGFAKFVAEDLPPQNAGRKALSDDGLAMIESIKEQTRANLPS